MYGDWANRIATNYTEGEFGPVGADGDTGFERLRASVQAAINEERERCALIAEMSQWRTAAGEIAAAIRATPEKERAVQRGEDVSASRDPT